MSLATGTRLGSYEVVAQIGAGGMGEVYQAHDTKLGRDVAIKVLPEAFAQDLERLARFQREAKTLAALNHPNIATIHGFEESNGTHYLVMELVSGETLADHIRREGAVPVDEALAIAKQIAEALEAAHEKGIIHRDLKPANVKVTPEGKVKVLDFGLAKAFAGEGAIEDTGNSPTLSMAATQQGIILGTAAYMSPEQARGKTVDKRTDIWAFGAVLCEMLTGKQLFSGEAVSETLAFVMSKEPTLDALPAKSPPAIRKLLRRCLVKEPRRRLRDIGEARILLEDVFSGAAAAEPVTAAGAGAPKRPALFFGLGVALLAAATAGIAAWILKPVTALPGTVSRFVYELPQSQTFTNNAGRFLAVSPDGVRIAYVANNQIYVRAIREFDSRPLAGTEAGQPLYPFFSPDGQWIGYFSGRGANRQLKKIAVSGGIAVTLADVKTPFGASWDSDGTIVFGQPGGVLQVSENGGVPEVLVATEPGEQVEGPQVLPGGRWVLFALTSAVGPNRWDQAQVVAQSLETGERKILREAGRSARYAQTGHLVYAQGDVLFAVPFDVDTMAATGGAVPVVQGVIRASGALEDNDAAEYAFSEQGMLVYATGTPVTEDRVLALADRTGNVEALNVPPKAYLSPRFSPNGKQIAVQTTDDAGSQIWIYDLSGRTVIRQLTQSGNNIRPTWTPNGQRLAFASDRDGTMSIYWKAANGSGVAERLTTAEEGTEHWPESFTPDGRTLSFSLFEINKGTWGGIWTVKPDEGAEPKLFFDLPDNGERLHQLSPNGRWMAYSSGQGAPVNIYVQPFPATGEVHQITLERGAHPAWSRDGRELYFRSPGVGASGFRTLMMVDIATDGGVEFGNVQKLPIRGLLTFPDYRDYDLAPDGKRFVVVTSANETVAGDAGRAKLSVVLNWFEELTQRVPTGN